jgi:Protein tyrosine and serine/threonine kinase
LCYRSGGYYREVYLSKLPNDADVVFKHFYWGNPYEYDGYEYMRMDALVNEKLNGNPRIVQSYGFCAMSIIGEAMVNGDLEKLAVPSGKPRIRKPLDDKDHLVLGNNLTGTQKLEISLEMAEAVRVLHSYPGGVIVHDDIQLPQFLFSSNSQLKLNDFNRAEIMLWNEKDQEYCRYRNEPGKGDVRVFVWHGCRVATFQSV